MSPQDPKIFAPQPVGRNAAPGLKRDIIWGRPIFPPPQLPNPRVIFDPLPFTALRRCAGPQALAGR